MKDAWRLLGAACALVIGVSACTAQLSALESLILNAADTPYNLLVQGFRAGQLSLKKELPPGFAQLADPYDPVANRAYRILPYRMSDLSYYKGKLYLYFGITPALIVFWPYVALTGHYLFPRHAVTVFCAVGILASVGLLRALWRRYFPEVSVWVAAACALALGLASGLPMLLPRSDVYEVAISCGYMLTMLTLAAIWCALHEPRRRSGWLAVASVAYGLAVGARPSLLFGAAILLVPVAHAWRERWPESSPRSTWLSALLAATGPILLIGLGLMLYNVRRFGSPFEFGVRYQVTAACQVTQSFFSPHYLWFNFRVYFLEPLRWSTPFPFVHGIAMPPIPPGYSGVAQAFGVLTNTPVVWLALAAPLAWHSQPPHAASILRWFVTGVTLLLGMCALPLGLFWGANFRYEVEFLPALLLLAAVGILGLERAMAGRLVQRRVVRWGWGLLLGFSVATNVLMGLENYAYAGCALGTALAEEGHVPEAIHIFGEALRIKPDFAEGHNNLGTALEKTGRVQEAIEEYEQALRLRPDYPEAHNELGLALARLGRLQEAIEQYEQALRVNPDFAEAHNNLGTALAQTGKSEEAIKQLLEASRLLPNTAEVYFNLGNVLRHVGKVQEAIAQYEHALRVNPDFAEAHNNLGTALNQTGKSEQAMDHWKQALQIRPDYARAHYNLGVALEQAGKLTEAIQHYQHALRINPDFTDARTALARLQGGQ